MCRLPDEQHMKCLKTFPMETAKMLKESYFTTAYLQLTAVLNE